MPFMVIYRTSDGVTRYEQSGAIDEAALFVERLRNKDAIDQIRIYRMEEIGFAFRPYYKVELGTHDRPGHNDAHPGSDGGEPPAAEVAEAAQVEEPPVAPAAEAVEVPDVAPEAAPPLPPPPVPETAGANGNGTGRQGLFGR